MKKDIVIATVTGQHVVTEDSDIARELYNQGRYGMMVNNRVQLSLIEAHYLIEKERLLLQDGRGKAVIAEMFLKKAQKLDQNFWVKYSVFKDIRNRGYIIKTALKFGADFRVYERGVKPGDDHAKWIVYPVHENATLTWHEFSAKNRVAHSTKKRLMIGIVDDEGDVTYYECRWLRP